jgi:hypothetical protein
MAAADEAMALTLRVNIFGGFGVKHEMGLSMRGRTLVRAGGSLNLGVLGCGG